MTIREALEQGAGGESAKAERPDGSSAAPLDLVGSQVHALDNKRRVAIPKSFRDQVDAAGLEGETYVLCRQLGGDPCLTLFPPGRFEQALQKLEGMRSATGVGSKEVRAYLRKVRISAARIIPDRQSRITLNEEQCRLAGIERDVAFVGAGDHMELWAPARLEGEDDEDDDFGALANSLFG